MAAIGGHFAGLLNTLGLGLGLGLGAGALANGYESAPVRDALIRLAGTPEGSTGFEQALKHVIDLVGATAKGNVQSQ